MCGIYLNKAVICFGTGTGGGKKGPENLAMADVTGSPFDKLKKGGGRSKPGSRYNNMRAAAGRRAAGGR